MSGPKRAQVPWAAYGALAASMALVGSYVGLSRLLVAAFPVFLLAWLRFGMAAVAMAGWLRAAPGEPQVDASTRRLLFLESFFGNFLFSICMLFGVQATSAVAAGVVMAALPATVAVMSALFLGARIGRRMWAAIALAVAGVMALALLKAPETHARAAPWWGYALLVGAVLCEAAYVVIGKRLSAALSPRRISAWINLWGLLLVTPFGLWQALRFDFSSVAVPVWGLLLFYALAASVWTVWLWMRGLQQVPAERAGVFTVLLPITAAAVGVLVLGEPFGLGHALALVAALAGLLLATWPQRALAPS